MAAKTTEQPEHKITQITREDTASLSLLARDPAIWFFLNLLMSSIGKTNEHLEQLHVDLREIIQTLDSLNHNSEAMICAIGERPGRD